jgi:hypothetical protein
MKKLLELLIDFIVIKNNHGLYSTLHKAKPLIIISDR